MKRSGSVTANGRRCWALALATLSSLLVARSAHAMGGMSGLSAMLDGLIWLVFLCFALPSAFASVLSLKLRPAAGAILSVAAVIWVAICFILLTAWDPWRCRPPVWPWIGWLDTSDCLTLRALSLGNVLASIGALAAVAVNVVRWHRAPPHEDVEDADD